MTIALINFVLTEYQPLRVLQMLFLFIEVIRINSSRNDYVASDSKIICVACREARNSVYVNAQTLPFP